MRTPLLLLTLLTTAVSANARLGETPAQITTRYGALLLEPTIMGTNQWVGSFQHAGFSIHATFWKGKCVEESFLADDSFSEDDARKMFSSVTGEGTVDRATFPAKDDDCPTVYFSNLTSGASGWYNGCGTNDRLLRVEDKSYYEFLSKEAADEKKKNLAGF